MKKAQFDAILVLGGGVRDDGSLPLCAALRVQKAVELFKQGAAPVIVMSGGWYYKYTTPPSTTEAQAMKSHAKSLGINPTRIYTERWSKNTVGNALYLKSSHIKPRQWKNVLIVTSKFHLVRAGYVFQKIMDTDVIMTFLGTKSGFSPKTLARKRRSELKALNFTKSWLDSVPDGQDQIIRKMLCPAKATFIRQHQLFSKVLALT